MQDLAQTLHLYQVLARIQECQLVQTLALELAQVQAPTLQLAQVLALNLQLPVDQVQDWQLILAQDQGIGV